MNKDDVKQDNIEHDSVESIIEESEENITESDTPNYFRISGNLRFEYGLITKLKSTLNNTNAISVQDIETLIGYIRDIDELMLILMDYYHTLKALQDFDNIFKLREVNGGTFVIRIFTNHRRRKHRKRTRRRLKL